MLVNDANKFAQYMLLELIRIFVVERATMIIIKCPKCSSREITKIAGEFRNSNFDILACSVCDFFNADFQGAESSLAGFITRFMTNEFCSVVLADLLEHRNRFDFSRFLFARNQFESGRIKNAEVVRKIAKLMEGYEDERTNSVLLANEKVRIRKKKALEKAKATREHNNRKEPKHA